MDRMLRCILAGLALAGAAAAQTFPAGFVRERIGGTFADAIALCWIDETRLLVAERIGRLWYVEDDVARNLVYDLSGETSPQHNRGLFGLAVAPDFDVSGWIYVLHSLRLPGEPSSAPTYGRLIRVRAQFEPSGELVARPETREILLGDSWATGIPSCVDDHTLGSVRFLSDGSLVLSTGDNSTAGFNPGGQEPACFLPGRVSLDQDLGSFRSQYLDSLNGKVLRIDPETGLGLADNPFFTGNPADLRSRVYARGLRNPFRFTVLPGTGPREALMIADVGWNTWEELDLCLGGENFGWPCFEGAGPAPQYPAADTHGFCAAAEPTAPLLAWHHSQAGASFVGQCASALCVYRGERYPPFYRGRLFFFDFERGWLRAAELGPDLTLQSTTLFSPRINAPVELVAQPGTGDLVYISQGTSATSVFRIRYVGNQTPPIAVASATPSFGPGDLDVVLSAEGSHDPDGQPLDYSWDLGDGSSATGPLVAHHYPAGSAFVARLTVVDAEGLAASAEVRITPGNTPPRILAVVAPRDGDIYVDGEPLRMLARVTDAEEATPAASWALDLVHGHHVHPDFQNASGLEALLVPESDESGDIHFRVRFAVTDASGLRDERSLEIYDAHGLPQAHLVELSTDSLRVGQALSPVGHVDYARGPLLAKQAELHWDWGDGSRTVIAEARHHVDSRPAHVYRAPGTYKLRLTALLSGQITSAQEAEVRVAPPWPAVALFLPREGVHWISVEEQDAIRAALERSLAPFTSAVRSFQPGEGADLARWMEPFSADAIPDVVVLLGALPAALVEGGIPGSLLDRWVAAGNGIVWSGNPPFQAVLGDDGHDYQLVQGADLFFGATAPFIQLGEGPQRPTALAATVVPSLREFAAIRALRFDQLGPLWRVTRIFAADGDSDSDALELEHTLARGFYAQFLCTDAVDVPRAEVLTEYLTDRLRSTRRTMPPAGRH